MALRVFLPISCVYYRIQTNKEDILIGFVIFICLDSTQGVLSQNQPRPSCHGNSIRAIHPQALPTEDTC